VSDDFEEVFKDAEDFQRRLLKKMFKEMDDIEEAIKSGSLEGEWDIKPIEEPGVKGYIAKGRFQYGDKTTPKTLKLPKLIQEEVREPLTDVFQDKGSVKLYLELPGVEKTDIKLDVTQGRVEVKARNFYKAIELPTSDVEPEKAKANYRNGVLEVTLPRASKPASAAGTAKTTIKTE